MSFIEKLVGDLGDKKRWREYKARVKALPEPYRTAVAAVERYLMYAGPLSDESATLVRMFDDLADLFEQAAADGTPVRAIVGEDPVEFVETFVANYAGRSWRTKEQERLKDAIAKAEAEA